LNGTIELPSECLSAAV